jgi:thioredoxin-dependent peroxiredoxin
MIEAGQKAPDFKLAGDDGAVHALKDHKGSPVVVYFYPKDDTPGCTTEACDFRDHMARLTKAGAVVYGVSKDPIAKHEKFKAKHDLNFVLLSDAEGAAHEAYGTWGDKVLYGRKFQGTIRSTFLIDGKGKVARVWPKVKVKGHVDEVLAAVQAL